MLRVAMFALLPVVALACSLVVDKSATQCARDQDCRVSPFSKCSSGLCIDPKGTAGAGECIEASGCVCAPRTNTELLNGCTDNACLPFDNSARLKNLGPDGKLKPLVR